MEIADSVSAGITWFVGVPRVMVSIDMVSVAPSMIARSVVVFSMVFSFSCWFGFVFLYVVFNHLLRCSLVVFLA